MSTEAALIAEWEAVLVRERLRPVGDETGRVRPEVVRSSGNGSATIAVDTYLEWARDVLETCPFGVTGQGIPSPLTRRKVWTLHATGASNHEVMRQLRIEHRTVRVAIAVTKREAGLPPVVNPWRCSGRDREEQRIREESDMDPKRRSVEYARIVLRETMEIPGIHTARAILIPTKGHSGIVMPLMGIPHAGGIDVEFATEHQLRGEKRPTKTVITIPWGNIKKAEQVPEEVEA